MHNNIILLRMSIFYSENMAVKIPHLEGVVAIPLTKERKRLNKENNVKVKLNKEKSNEYYLVYEGSDENIYLENKSED